MQTVATYYPAGGLQCVNVRHTDFTKNSENHWNAEFTLVNNCGFDVLVRLDSADKDEDDGDWH